MSLLLGFAPLVIYSVFAPLSVSLAVWLAFAAAFAFAVRSFVETGVLRLLDGTGVFLFGSLALADIFLEQALTQPILSLIVVSGMLLMAMWSLALRRPFAQQYFVAHATPGPARANLVLTTAWTAAFAVMAFADAAAAFLHRIPSAGFTVASLAALAGALTFTWQYGVYIGRRLGRIPLSGRR